MGKLQDVHRQELAQLQIQLADASRLLDELEQRSSARAGSLSDGKKVMVDQDGFGSLYGSSRYADAFNVKFDVYKEKQDVKSYIDPSITAAAK